MADAPLPPGTPRTANVLWFDALVRHQIHLLRAAGSVRNDLIDLLNATERDIARQIRERLRGPQQPTAATMRRLAALSEGLRRIREGAWAEARPLMRRFAGDLAVSEARFFAGALQTVVPVTMDPVLPPAQRLRALVAERPFQGKLLAQHMRDLQRADVGRIDEQIRIGVVQGETGDQLARRVVGTVARSGTDGITQITRRNLQAITRTATIAYSNAARNEFLAENADVFAREIFVATLDANTTPVCRQFDGQRFDHGRGPQPPLHFLCRSTRVAEIDGQALGERPAKPTTRQEALRQFTRRENLGRITSRDRLPRGTKGRFDQFERQLIRDTTGQVPSKVTYQEWLRGQPARIQDDILGRTKGKLFREGNLTLDRFVAADGRELNLAQLARADREAFVRAGLDPGDFL